MKKFQVVVKCSIGIHARPAAQIAQACSNLRAAVTLEVGKQAAGKRYIKRRAEKQLQ